MTRLEEAIVLSRSRSGDLASVRKLNLWGMELEDISIIRKMPNLEVVSLSVNNVNTLADFQDCSSLQELYVRNNDIADLNEVWYLKALPQLKVLWLSENPCAIGTQYRQTVIRNLPNLTKLDNVPVTTEERNAATVDGMELVKPSIPPTLPRTVIPGTEPSVPCRPPAASVPPDSSPATPAAVHGDVPAVNRYHRSANILQAVLCLLKELDEEGLNRVNEEIQRALLSIR